MFELSAHMTIRPGQLEGFKQQAAEIIRLTQENDTQPFDTTGSSAGTAQSARFASFTRTSKGSLSTKRTSERRSRNYSSGMPTTTS